MSDASTADPTNTNTNSSDTANGTDSPWAAFRRPPDLVAAARRDLETGRRIGLAVTAVYLGFALLSALAGLDFHVVSFLLIAALFGYGTATAVDSPRTARHVVFVGVILGAPLGLTMLVLIKRIKEYEAALARPGRP